MPFPSPSLFPSASLFPGLDAPAGFVAATELGRRFYLDLPEHYRVADAELGQPLYRWTAGLLDVAGDLEGLVDRVDYVSAADGGAAGDTSDLADPRVAEPAWLPWLGQFVGVRVNTAVPVAGQRDAVASAVSGFRAGSRPAIAAAAKSLLTGSQHVDLYPNSVSVPGNGGEWDVLVVTRDEETPFSGDELVQRVIAQGAKPAGVVLHHRSFTATWDAIDAAHPTWAATEGKTWNQIDDTGLA